MGISAAMTADRAGVDARAVFISKTYMHLMGAIIAFVGAETYLFKFTDLPMQALVLLAQNRFYWLAVLGLFLVVGWIAEKMARNATSLPAQYFGLTLYVAAEVVIFLPLLAMAVFFTDDPTILPTAAIATLALFGALSVIVFLTRKDFSFLKGILGLAGFAALGMIVAAIVFDFQLGPIFSVAMIALASGYVLYYTSNVLHHYRTDQHVSASLALFAAIALMFWYVLRLLMQLRR